MYREGGSEYRLQENEVKSKPRKKWGDAGGWDLFNKRLGRRKLLVYKRIFRFS